MGDSILCPAPGRETTRSKSMPKSTNEIYATLLPPELAWSQIHLLYTHASISSLGAARDGESKSTAQSPHSADRDAVHGTGNRCTAGPAR